MVGTLIKDDRGAARPLFDERGVPPRGDDGAARAAAKKGDQLTGPLTREQVLVLAGVFASVCAVALLSNWMGSWAAGWVKNVVGLAVAIILPTVVVRGLRRRAARAEIRAALLEAGRCASCGYSLKELGASGDGCVVCAECGGAWRVTGAV